MVASSYTAVQPFTIGSNSAISTTSVASLTYAVPVSRATLERGDVIPFAFSNSAAFTISSAWTAQAQIVTPSHTYNPGDTVPANTAIPAGSSFAAGNVIPVQGATKTLAIKATTIPAGTPLDVFSGSLLVSQAITIPAGGQVPAGSSVVGVAAQYSTRPLNPDGTQGQIMAVAPMLPAGDLSWSLQLTAGADLAAADAARVNSLAALAGSGNLVLDDAHFGGANLQTPSFSVLRTGTGSLGPRGGRRHPGGLRLRHLYRRDPERRRGARVHLQPVPRRQWRKRLDVGDQRCQRPLRHRAQRDRLPSLLPPPTAAT